MTLQKLCLFITFVYAVIVGNPQWGWRLALLLCSLCISLSGIAGLFFSPFILVGFVCTAIVALVFEGILSMIFLGYESAKRPGIVVALLAIPDTLMVFGHFVAILISILLIAQAIPEAPKQSDDQFDAL